MNKDLFLPIEVWTDIKGYEGYYQVSNLGRFKSLTREVPLKNKRSYIIEGKLLNPSIDAYGYVIVGLAKDGVSKSFKAHRLVAMAFIDNHECKPQVNHINGIKNDNRVENLEWVTNKENVRHAIETGLIDRSVAFKLKHEDILEVYNLLLKGLTVREISSKYNVSESLISNIKTGYSFSNITNVEYKQKVYKNNFSEEEVLNILRLINELKSPKRVSELLKINLHVIEDIKRGKSWSNITGIKYKKR